MSLANILALASSALWGTSDFLGGTAARTRPAWVVLVWSQAIAFVVVALAAWLHGDFATVTPGPWMVWAAAAGICGAVGIICLYRALAEGTMGVVSPIVALGVLVPFSAGLIVGDQLTNIHIFGVIAAIVGIVLASAPEVTGKAGWRPVMFAIAAAVLLGGSMLGLAFGAEGSVLVTLVIMRAAAAVVAPFAYARSSHMRGLPLKLFGLYALIGIIEVVANATFGFSKIMPGASLALISVLGSLYPITTVVLAAVVHKERMALVLYIGVAFAMTGVAFVCV